MSPQAHFTPQWVEPKPVKIPDALRQAIDGPELLLQTLVRRGLSDPQKARAFLYPDEYVPTPATELPGMARSVARIQTAINNKEKIGVWGDFDVDGQTSTSILVAGFRKLGAEVVYHIPIRETESHGILLAPLKAFLQSGISLIVTCDTGISANESIAYAMQTGVDVIVTDHHSLPETLPAAYAIVDPQLLSAENHPLRTLSGSGVAYKMIEQLLLEAGRGAEAEELVDLAAFGLVADIATLTGDARYLVQRGLQHMRSQPRAAFARIFSDNHIVPDQVNEETISFVLAPRINAVGRLSDANPMVEYLLSDDPVLIATTTNSIEGLNSQRKLLCDQVFRGALAQIEQNPKLLDAALLLLAHPGWPGGVVGIVASRLVELYHRPAILMNTGGGMARGSARSIEGVNITQALVENKALLKTFGGHPMAAGMATAEENVDMLRRGLSRSVERMMQEAEVQPSLEVDAVMELENIDLDLLSALNLLAPFGPGNPPLRFASQALELAEAMPFGKTKEHLQMIVQAQNGTQHRVIWWQGVELPRPENRFDLAYKARGNTFRGKTEVQFEWVDYREGPEESMEAAHKKRKKNLLHIDLRTSNDPLEDLQQILAEQEAQIWSEGSANCPVASHPRSDLTEASVLVIWATPASPQTLLQVLDMVRPQKIYWFAVLPAENDLKTLIKECFLIVRKKLSDQAQIQLPLNELAGALATTPRIALLALQGLQAQGQFSFAQVPETDQIEIRSEQPAPLPQRLQVIQTELAALHREVTAYRALYQKTAAVADLLPDAYKPER